MMQNRAAYMTEKGKITIVDIPVPEPAENEVLLRIEYVGICGSDAHFLETGMRKGKSFNLPFILGHECSATIVEIGKGVTDLAIGDRVTFEPQITCGKCHYCREGKYNLCPHVMFPSVPPYDGMLRKYTAIPASVIRKLPPAVSFVEGAMIEPLAVGLSAANRGEVTIGSTVIILGTGCIGLTTLLACRASGATKIIVVDICDSRLEMARALGADVAIKNSNAMYTDAKLKELTNGEGAEIVFETAGNTHTALLAEKVLQRGGRIVHVGNIHDTVPYPFMDLMYKEGEIRTIYRYRNNFNRAIDAVASGIIDIKKIAPIIFPFEKTQEAFNAAIYDAQHTVKAMVAVNTNTNQ
jgi:L-iditol 2-dehydrogenase